MKSPKLTLGMDEKFSYLICNSFHVLKINLLRVPKIKSPSVYQHLIFVVVTTRVSPLWDDFILDEQSQERQRQKKHHSTTVFSGAMGAEVMNLGYTYSRTDTSQDESLAFCRSIFQSLTFSHNFEIMTYSVNRHNN